MDRDNNPKNRDKGSYDPTKPYQRPKSLMDRMSKIKDYMSPSFLLRMVSPSTSSGQPAVTNHNNHHSRLQAHSDGMQRDYHSQQQTLPDMLSTPNLSFMTQSTLEGTSGQEHMPFTPTPHPFAHYNRQHQPLVNGGDDQTEPHDYNTMAAAPMMPMVERRDYGQDMMHMQDPKLRSMQRQMSASYMHGSVGTPGMEGTMDMGNMSTCRPGEGSFLWSNKAKSRPSIPQPTAQVQKPSFNVSAFSKSVMSPDKSAMLGQEYGQSPYYPGKTAFGGATAHRKSRLASASPYQASPSRRQVQAKPVNRDSLSGVTSSTAKLILDTLERMSTPISDAKKIPAYESSVADSPLSFTPGQYRRKNSFLNKSRPQANTGGPPVNQLNTSGFASIGVNRHSTPPVSTNTSRVPEASPRNTQGEYTSMGESQFPAESASTNQPAGGKSGKIKQKRGGHHYSSRRDEEDEEVEMPDLPTSFTLPVTQMPVLNLGKPAHNSAAAMPTATRAVPESMPHNHVSPAQTPYTFSSPISHSPVSTAISNVAKTFEFSSPLHVDAKSVPERPASNFQSAVAGSQPGFSSGFAMSSSNVLPKPKPMSSGSSMGSEVSSPPSGGGIAAASELKSGSVMDILGGSSSGGSGIKVASSLKSGSVMSVLGGSGASPLGSGGIKAASELKSGSVMDVLGGNKMESDTNSTGFGSLFKKAAGSWECSACMVQNKAEANKCVACESAKPSQKPQEVAPPAMPAGSGFGSLFKKAAGSWECSACMVQNKPESSKCAACETPKPAAKPQTTAPPPTVMGSGSGFGSLFKSAAGSWECDSCMVKNKPEVSKCVACETPKPGAKPTAPQPAPTLAQGSGFGSQFKAASGSWECPTCMLSNKADRDKCLACEAARPGAKPAQKSTVSSGGFGSQFKASGSMWTCDTCLVQNKGDASKCIACETSKPGAKPTTGFTSSGGFKFNASGSVQLGDVKGTSSISFGNVSGNPSTEDKNSSGFKLPTSSSTETKPAGFQFNSGSSTGSSSVAFGNVEGKPASSTPTPSGFAFSAPSQSTTDSAKTTVQFGNTATPVKEEGEKSAVSSSGLVGSQKPVNGNGATSGGFVFGSLPPKSDTATKTEGGSAPVFGFASKPESKAADTPGGLVFNSASSKDNGIQISTGFTFGNSSVKEDSSKTATSLFSAPSGIASSSGAESGVKDTTVKPEFSFGQKDTSISGASIPSSNFSFGLKPAAPTSTQETKTSESSEAKAAPTQTGLFSFGGTKPTENAPVFGQTTEPSKAAPSVGGFKFGATDNKPVFGAGSGSLGAGSGSLGTANPAMTTPAAPAFSFGTKPSEPIGNFGFQSADSSKRGRDDGEEGVAAKKANFSFGSAATDSSSVGFKFGTTAAPADPPAATSLFSFNAKGPSNPGTTTTSSTGGFVFGQGSSAPGFGGTAATNHKQGADCGTSGTDLGLSGHLADTAALTGSSLTLQSPVSMEDHTALPQMQFSAPSFTFPAVLGRDAPPAQFQTTASFNFGQSAPGFGQSATSTTSQPFQFSANTQTASSNNTASSSSTSGFQFGSAAQTPVAQQTGFNFSAATAPNFAFGGANPASQPSVFGAASTGAQQPAFQFSASGGQAGDTSNPFNATVTGTPSTSRPRAIRKAVRKLRK